MVYVLSSRVTSLQVSNEFDAGSKHFATFKLSYGMACLLRFGHTSWRVTWLWQRCIGANWRCTTA